MWPKVEPVPIMLVMAGLVPAIHAMPAEQSKKDVDARDKRGHDDSI